MALTRYERTKQFRRSHPAYRRIERNTHYAKHVYSTPNYRPKYSQEDVIVILTKQWHGRQYVDRLIAKKLKRSLRAIHAYRSLLLSDRAPLYWQVLVRQLREKGRIWQKP